MELIYYTIGGNPIYSNILKLSIDTLIKYGKYNGDIVVITDSSTIDNVKQIEYIKDVIHVDEISNGHESSINKLKIYKYKNIYNYKKILYLDIDILIQNDIEKIFKKIKNISVVEEKELMIDNVWFGNYMLTKPQQEECVKNKIHGINAGTIGFDIDYLKNIIEIESYVSLDSNKNIYAEQPSVNNYLLNNRDIYNSNLTEDVVLFAKPADYIINKEKTILHFCGGIGSYTRKITEMLEYYRMIHDNNQSL